MPHKVDRPRAITMWDFSWIERRWPGAGYEDWDRVLDELVERGYDAVRIDAYPHLISADPKKLWTVFSCGQDGDWGAPSEVDIHVCDTLIEFVSKCRDRNIAVGLSSWFKRDPDDVRMSIKTPRDHAQIWCDTLAHLDEAGLLDTILFVDFCNEFPLPKWAPFLYDDDNVQEESLSSKRLKTWMAEGIAEVKEAYPSLDYTFSFTTQFTTWAEQDVTALDLLELHIWMGHPTISPFLEKIGYSWKEDSFQKIVRQGKQHYLENQSYYDKCLTDWIDRAADWSRATGKPIVTTESWALVNYRDWPMLEWDWIKDLCALGVETAAASGRWTAICTSNFCGPQYRGMWRDVEWHKRMTDQIKSSPLAEEFRT